MKKVKGIIESIADINKNELTHGLSEWRAYQLLGMYETLIIIEADTGWMKIWDEPLCAYFIVKSVKMISATERTYE